MTIGDLQLSGTRPGLRPPTAKDLRRRSRRRRVRAFARAGIPLRGHPALWVLGQVAAAAGLGLAASVLVLLSLALGGLGTGFWPLWSVLTGGLLAHWALGTLRDPFPGPVPELADDGMADFQQRPFTHADRWERRLSTTDQDPEWYTRVVRDRLTVLVGERLRQRQGIGLSRDPDRARAVLGDELHRFLTEPLTRTPDPAELGRLITRMEEI